MPQSPRKTLNLKALTQGSRALAVVFCITLAGCQSMGDRPADDHSRDTDRAVGLEQEPEWLTDSLQPLVPEEPKDIWERGRAGTPPPPSSGDRRGSLGFFRAPFFWEKRRCGTKTTGGAARCPG